MGCLTIEAERTRSDFNLGRARGGGPGASGFEMDTLKMVPQEGLEPPTPSLRMTCSTN
jgi:hypothetical protein